MIFCNTRIQTGKWCTFLSGVRTTTVSTVLFSSYVLQNTLTGLIWVVHDR